ncbi:MAG: type VI secretion system accessory protein TagJ [Janthinobacterium lividum]
MEASALYKAGQLGPAIEALGLELRKQPTDIRRRTFLFELLCFAGEYDRASKQLDVLASSGKDAESGAMLYRAALHAQRTRDDMFAMGALPQGEATLPPAGLCDDVPFQAFTDEDDRIGANLEVFIAGSYTWIPFHYIERVDLEAPTRLRDLLWAPAILHTSKAFRLQDLGQVLLPVLAPLSWKHPDDAVRLGRTSVWIEDAALGAIPAGQKMFLADDEAVPLLQIRQLSFQQGPVTTHELATASEG